MYKTGICFYIDNDVGELVEVNGRLLRLYDNGRYGYSDDIDECVFNIVNDDECFHVEGIIDQIAEDTARLYSLC